MTYNDIKNEITNFITTNCANITNYSGIPICFKANYSVSGNSYNSYPQGTGLNDAWKKKYTVVILTPIQQITSAKVENDITYYIKTMLNIKDLSGEITSQMEKILFFNDMINFCCNTLCYVVSKYSSSKYLIYKSNLSLQNINIGKDYASYNFPLDEIIKNQDVNTILLTVFNNIRNSLKTQAIKYNYISGGM